MYVWLCDTAGISCGERTGHLHFRCSKSNSFIPFRECADDQTELCAPQHFNSIILFPSVPGSTMYLSCLHPQSMKDQRHFTKSRIHSFRILPQAPPFSTTVIPSTCPRPDIGGCTLADQPCLPHPSAAPLPSQPVVGAVGEGNSDFELPPARSESEFAVCAFPFSSFLPRHPSFHKTAFVCPDRHSMDALRLRRVLRRGRHCGIRLPTSVGCS